MACSTDFKKLHDLYQSEGVPKGISIVPLPVSAPVSSSVIASFDIRFSNGLHIHHEQLDYRSFCALVEKLEVLCLA